MNKIELGKIELKGIGLTRGVYMEGEPLTPKGRSFDWGYPSSSSKELAKAIVLKLAEGEHSSFLADFSDKPVEVQDNIINEFNAVFVCSLPQRNFSVLLEVRKWIHWMTIAPKEGELLRTSMSLMHIKYEPKGVHPIVISKYLDFPNMNIAAGVFEKSTIEYKLIMDLCGGQIKDGELIANDNLNTLVDYYKINTKSYDHRNPKVARVANLQYSAAIDSFVYSKGLGSIHDYRGHSMDKYDYSL